ncbi:hypothetical protein POM88_027939 [Heracleum sosnowskyi]|uniref:Uncharacterized protein n=1 Tax=Heracleum sosnowskyi TaxID=360622 RepID=A0AAD8MLX5_9APIA|nr:hypothetical protein POM88_027939 [Heracleum sosnowskyi]
MHRILLKGQQALVLGNISGINFTGDSRRLMEVMVETITKPIENLPSAEIQLERREAERVGAAKDSPIVTPLMQFVRQKRAAKGGSRRFLSNGKPTRTGGISSGTSGSLRRGSEKKKDLQTILKQGFKLCHFTLSMPVRHVEEQLLKAVE